MSTQKSSSGPQIPRRENTRLTRGQARKYATVLIAELLGTLLARDLVSSFELRMLQEKSRPPTPGEKNLFVEQVGKVITAMQKKAKDR